MFKKSISALALTCAATAAFADQAQPAEVSAPLDQATLRAPFSLNLDLYEEDDVTGRELDKAMDRLSTKHGKPPLLELPGKVLDAIHKEVVVPIAFRREARETQQLACSVALQKHGFDGIMEAMLTPYFTKLQEAGQLTDKAYDDYVLVNTANRGYFVYGNMMMHSLDNSQKGIVNAENIAKVATVTPKKDTKEYAEVIHFCARLARDVSRFQETNERLQNAYRAGGVLDKQLNEVLEVVTKDSQEEGAEIAAE